MALYRFSDASGNTRSFPKSDNAGTINKIYISSPVAGFEDVDKIAIGDVLGDDLNNGSIFTVVTVENINRFVFVLVNGAKISVRANSNVCVHSPIAAELEAKLIEVGWSICVNDDHDNPVAISSIETIN